MVFFPSQPTFDPHTAKQPVDAIDLLWNIVCPMAFLIGDEDPVLPADRLADVRQRFEQWGVDATITLYQGAGHVFNAHGSALYNEAADEQSWQDAVESVTQQLNPEPSVPTGVERCVKRRTFLATILAAALAVVSVLGPASPAVAKGTSTVTVKGPGRRPADLARQ